MSEEDKGKLLKDINGSVSSKRVAGFFSLAVFAAISILTVIRVPEMVANIIWPWAVITGALFGATILEKKV